MTPKKSTLHGRVLESWVCGEVQLAKILCGEEALI